VNFSGKNYSSVVVRASSKTGGVLRIRLHDAGRSMIAQVKIPAGNTWKIVKAPLSGVKPGIQNVVVSLFDNRPVAVDWIRFE
jgi:hypothetical protein